MASDSANKSDKLIVEMRSSDTLLVDGQAVALGDLTEVVTNILKRRQVEAEIHFYWPESRGMSVISVSNELRGLGIERIVLKIYQDGKLLVPNWQAHQSHALATERTGGV